MENKPIKILAVDDNFDNLVTIQALTFEAFPQAEIILATSGKEALELAVNEKPDVILLDIVMPEMDGFEVCQRLKSDKNVSDIPVVFVTALKGEKESRIRALEVGAEAFLAKPIDETELVAQIRAMVKIRHANIEKITENQRLAILVSEQTRELKKTHTATLNLLEDLRNQIETRKQSEVALRESEEKYRSLVENSPNGVAVYQEGKFVFINTAGVTILGAKTKEEVLGKSVLSIVHPDSIADVVNRMTMVSRGIDVPPLEEKLIQLDGTVFYAEVAALGTTYNNELAGQVIVTNITERKLAQDALRESEEKYRFMTENIGDVLWHMDYNFCFDYLSPAIELMQGYKAEELIGKQMFSLLKPEGVRHIQEGISNVKKRMESGKLEPEMQFEYESVCKDGSWIWVEVNVTIQLDNQMKPIGFQGVTRDITDRKKIQIALRESEEKFRVMANLLPQVVFEINLTGELTYLNQHAKTLFGYEPEELIGKSSTVTHIPEERERATESIRKKILGDEISNKEFNMLRKDGTVFPALLSINVISKENKPVGIRGLVVDISDQKQAENAIRASESLYRAILDASPDNIIITNIEGKVEMISASSIHRLGLEDEKEIIGKVITDFIIDSDKDRVLSDFNLVAHGIKTGLNEYKSVHRDGTFIDIEVNGGIIRELNGEISKFVFIAHDITNRKLSEKALTDSQQELQTIYDNAPVMMCLLDEKRNILFSNNAFSAITNLIDNESTLSKRFGGVIDCIHAKDDARGCGFGKKCANCSLRTAIQKTFKTGIGEQNLEHVVEIFSKTTKESKEIYFLGSTAIIHSNQGENLLLCLHDITDRKAAEDALQKSETLLRTFIENSPFEIWARDTRSVGILENKKLIDHSGSIIGTTPQTDNQIDEETRQLWAHNNSRVLGGEIIDEEYEFMVNGELIPYQQIVFPIRNNDKLLGIAGFNIDISERKKAEMKILENNNRLEMAMKIANMAWWEMNLETGAASFGKRKTDMLGYVFEDFTNYHDFMKLVHPDDYEKTMEAMRDHIYGNNDKYEIEYRILTSSGQYKWFYDIGFVSKKDATGKPLIVSGLVLDITERKKIEKELSNQKQFFEQMFMQSSLSTQILDGEGWCERINPKLTQIFGVEAENIEGHVYNIFNDKEIKRNGIIPKLKNVFEKGETAEWEVFFDIEAAAESQHIEIKDKKKAWFSNWAYPVQDQNGDVSHVIIQHTDITDKKISEQALRESQELLKKFASHLQNVREEERVVLAREIHDELGQILVAMKIDLGMLKLSMLKSSSDPLSDDVMLKYDTLVNLVDSTIKTARKIMTDLRPEVLELLGFTEAVKTHLKSFSERYKIKSSFNNLFGDLDIDSQQAIALFRIIQEALNNVAKHAQATEVRIDLTHSDSNLVLKITDNGIGIDKNKNRKTESYGLIGMGERVFLLGGELTIKGEINEGTCIQVEVPYNR